MPRQNNVYQAPKRQEMKHLLLTHPCAPASQQETAVLQVLIQIQDACLHCSHRDYYTSALSAALSSTLN